MPCSSCAKRNDNDSCAYESSRSSGTSRRGKISQAEARLEHLEGLVKALSQSQNVPAPDDLVNHSAEKTQSNNSVAPNHSIYHGATHFSAVLEDVEELRRIMQTVDESSDIVQDASGDANQIIGILFSGQPKHSCSDIIGQYLPPRQKVDRCISAYFRARSIAAPFVHSAQFTRIYVDFWEEHETLSPLWISILFSILFISTKTLSVNKGPEKSAAGSDHDFLTAAAHCLVDGHYYKPQSFAVEALLLFSQAVCLTNPDIPSAVGTIFGILTRSATSMGYHRESHVQQNVMSVFDQEMRRRTWSLLMQLDMLVSFQLGLPSNVQYPTWDTKPPTNLTDSDFDEDTLHLPPARPDSEPTELIFYIAKHKLMTVFEKVIRHALSVSLSPEPELEALEQELRSTYEALPAVFHPRTLAGSFADSSSVIVTRLCVLFIYRKCLCVLHRGYATRGRSKSIAVCEEAALDMVESFLDVYPEFEPGGQLHTERWFMGSISWHDFLLGCSTLCLVICSYMQDPDALAGTAGLNLPRAVGILHQAKDVCIEQSFRSRDTRKIWRLIEAVVSRLDSLENGTLDLIGVMKPPGQHIAYNEDTYMIVANEQSDLPWSEQPTTSMKDPSWAFMEQFLDLNEDAVAEV